MRRRSAVVAAVLGLVLLLGAGCSGGDADEAGGDAGGSGDASAGVETAGDASSATVVAADGGGGGDGAAEEVAAGPEDLGAQAPPEVEAERIIYTSEVRVRVEDPAASAIDAVRLVEEAGGSLQTQDEREGEEVVTITVRVPVTGFRDALDALAGLGEVLDKHVAAEEVTDQIVDLEGRLENARASADRLRELYATATGVEQIVAIEQALTEREAEVESLAGQLQQLEDRADRSTITLTLVAEGEPVAAAEPGERRTGFGGGLRTGWDVIVGAAKVVATFAGFLVPFLPFVLVAVLIALLVRRIARRRSRGPEVATAD